ncbi:uncharacterized protein LOC144908157 [Branchiostoma floridae x Branchiostoma belcheri]
MSLPILYHVQLWSSNIHSLIPPAMNDATNLQVQASVRQRAVDNLFKSASQILEEVIMQNIDVQAPNLDGSEEDPVTAARRTECNSTLHAVRSVLPGKTKRGCAFHWTQAVYCKIQEVNTDPKPGLSGRKNQTYMGRAV